jgi:dihydroneopterin aldolase
MGKIALEKIELYGNHGAYESERKIRQKFVVSLSFEYDFESAAKDDDLTKTVNYEEVVAICKDILAIPRRLLETLVVSIAEKIRDNYPNAANISVTLSKPQVQMGIKLETVKVSYHIA